MFKTTKNDGKFAELEAAVATAAAALVSTKSATRATWDRVKDLRSALEDAPDSPALVAGLSEASGAHREARAADERAHEALKAAEGALVAAKEAPERAQTAALLKARKARISALRNELLPGLRDLQAEIVETHHNGLLFSLSGGSKGIHESLLDHLDFLISHLEAPGGLTLFLDHMATYASGIVSGERPLDLGANYVAGKRRLAKAS